MCYRVRCDFLSYLFQRSKHSQRRTWPIGQLPARLDPRVIAFSHRPANSSTTTRFNGYLVPRERHLHSHLLHRRREGRRRRSPCGRAPCGAAVGESRRSVGSAAGPSTKQWLLVFWASMGQSLLIVDWKAHEESILGLGPCKVHLRTNTLPVTP